MIALDAQKYSAYIRIHEKLAMNVICLENSQSNIAIGNISHMSWLLSGKSWGFTRGSVQLFVMNWGSSHERNTKTKTKGLWYPLKLFTSRFSRDGIGFLALLSEIYYFHAWWMTGALSQLLRPCAPIYLQAPHNTPRSPINLRREKWDGNQWRHEPKPQRGFREVRGLMRFVFHGFAVDRELEGAQLGNNNNKNQKKDEAWFKCSKGKENNWVTEPKLG